MYLHRYCSQAFELRGISLADTEGHSIVGTLKCGCWGVGGCDGLALVWSLVVSGIERVSPLNLLAMTGCLLCGLRCLVASGSEVISWF